MLSGMFYMYNTLCNFGNIEMVGPIFWHNEEVDPQFHLIFWGFVISDFNKKKKERDGVGGSDFSRASSDLAWAVWLIKIGNCHLAS